MTVHKTHVCVFSVLLRLCAVIRLLVATDAKPNYSKHITVANITNEHMQFCAVVIKITQNNSLAFTVVLG